MAESDRELYKEAESISAALPSKLATHGLHRLANTPTRNPIEPLSNVKKPNRQTHRRNMHFSTFTTVLALFGGAHALTKRCVNHGYGTFYNDNACQSGASTAFALDNPGCLANQFGRNSIYIQASCYNARASLIWSPGTNCNCQNDCAQVPNTQGCWNLNGHKGASSFRFIGGGCPANNC